MPITPLHMGVGFLIKPLYEKNFNLIIFSLCQIAMDAEVVFRVIFGITPIHGYANNLIGASILAIVLILFSKPVSLKITIWWNKNLSAQQQKYLQLPEYITSKSIFLSVFIGIYSHWLLDAIMHADTFPFYPFTEKNFLFNLMTIDNLNYLCTALTALGFITYAALKIQKKSGELK